MPARTSFMEARDACKPCQTSLEDDSHSVQQKLSKRSTVRSQGSTSTFSSSSGGSRTVTNVTFTQSRGVLGLHPDEHLTRVLKAKPSMTFSTGPQSTGMLTLLGQHFPELLSDGAFRRELERGRSQEPHSSLGFRKGSGLHQMAQDTRIDKGRSTGCRHQEYYASSWRSASSSRQKDPDSSVISLKRTSPAGINRVEASVRSKILRPEHARLKIKYPEILLETGKDEPSFASEGMLPLACSERTETDRPSSCGDNSIFEQSLESLGNKSGILYQSYVEDGADEESG